MSEMDAGGSLADWLDQDRDAVPGQEESEAGDEPTYLPLEANEADAAEQDRVLGDDEDDYR